MGQVLGPAGIPKGPSTYLCRQYCARPLAHLFLLFVLILAYIGATMRVDDVPFIGIQDVEEHARRRRAWTRGLGPAALNGYEHIMARRVHQLVNTLEQQHSPVALEKWFQHFTCVCSLAHQVVDSWFGLDTMFCRYDFMFEMVYVLDSTI